jgi:hypothetical protein
MRYYSLSALVPPIRCRLASELLDHLEPGEPVVADYRDISREFVALLRGPDAPAWTRDFRNVRRVRLVSDHRKQPYRWIC